MSFSSKASLNVFYGALGKPASQFKAEIESKFLPELKKPFIRGGPNRAKRKEVIQQAVDSIQSYANINVTEAATKRAVFDAAYRATFKDGLPPNSPSASVNAAKMKLISAKYNVLDGKFRLLDYWSGIGKGDANPGDEASALHWSTPYFLNRDPTQVRPVLQLLLGDAQKVLNKQVFSTDLQAWSGADHEVNVVLTKTNISRTLKVDASARAGVQGNLEASFEYKGFKGTANAELFAGARAGATVQASVSPDGFSAGATVECEVGIIVKADANLDIADVLEIGAEAEAFAGGRLNGEASIVLTRSDGVSVSLSGEAFAGVKISGSATGKLKLGGRDITTVKLEGSALAGAGASGELGFKCSLFGEFSFKAKGGVAAGVGAEAGADVTIDFHNIKWGAETLVWEYINEHGFKNQGKVWLLPVEENVIMADRARDALFKMMGELYRANEAEIAMMERWKVINRRVSARG